MAPRGPYRSNRYHFSDDGSQIIARDGMGHVFILDADDLPILLSRCFYRNSRTGYIEGKKNNRAQRLHRLIMRLGKADSGKGGVDHINGKSWDCRKSNLRAATNSQNQANRGVSIRSTTGIKGVFKNTPTPKWKNPKQPYKSSIRVRGNSIFLGYFDTIEQAKEAYDMASAEHFGEYARKG